MTLESQWVLGAETLGLPFSTHAAVNTCNTWWRCTLALYINISKTLWWIFVIFVEISVIACYSCRNYNWLFHCKREKTISITSNEYFLIYQQNFFTLQLKNWNILKTNYKLVKTSGWYTFTQFIHYTRLTYNVHWCRAHNSKNVA